MLSSISIKTDEVRGTNKTVDHAADRMTHVKDGVSHLIFQIDPAIKSRRSINSRLYSAFNSSTHLEAQLQHLFRFINNSVNQYCAADDYVNKKLLADFTNQGAGHGDGFFARLAKDLKEAEDLISDAGEAAVSWTVGKAKDILDDGVEALETIGKGVYDEWNHVTKWLDDKRKWFEDNKEYIARLARDSAILVGTIVLVAATGGAATPLLAAATVWIVANQAVQVGADINALILSSKGDKEGAKEAANQNIIQEGFEASGGLTYGTLVGTASGAITAMHGGNFEQGFEKGFDSGYSFGKKVGELDYYAIDLAANAITLKSGINEGVKSYATRLCKNPNALTTVEKVTGGVAGVVVGKVDGSMTLSEQILQVEVEVLGWEKNMEIKDGNWGIKIPVIGDSVKDLTNIKRTLFGEPAVTG